MRNIQFITSGNTGSWSCFCSDHLGQTSGTVRAFTPLGLVVTLSGTQFRLANTTWTQGRADTAKGRCRSPQGSRCRRLVELRKKLTHWDYGRPDECVVKVSVPTIIPSVVRRERSMATAKPKSPTLATPSALSHTFPGFKSRWTCPCCARTHAHCSAPRLGR